jgi:hypothetical protein
MAVQPVGFRVLLNYIQKERDRKETIFLGSMVL